MSFSVLKYSQMADDQFTSELEWLLRMRRESLGVARLIRRLRAFLLVAGSSQNERSLRVWVSPEVEQMYEDLDRLLSVLDPSTSRFLEGPVAQGSYLPKGTAGSTLTKPGELEDRRPIKGPGRRHGNFR